MTRDTSKRFLGKPCAYGHSGERYVSTDICVECQLENGPIAGTVPLPKKSLDEMRAAIRREVAEIMREPL